MANIRREQGRHGLALCRVNLLEAESQQLQAEHQYRQPGKTALLAAENGRTGRAGRGEAHVAHRSKQRLFLSMRWATRSRNFMNKVID